MSSKLPDLGRSAWKIIPKFECSDVQQSIDFYVDQLGFYLGGVHTDEDDSEGPTMCSVAMGRKAAANIYLFKKHKGHPISSSIMIALGTIQLDEYYAVLKEKVKVKIIDEIENKPWGYRQFEIEDPDGNRIQFFKFIEGSNGESEAEALRPEST